MPTDELYKDKIEVSLDGRQIFYLFFGGAVIVGLVFVLGVMVGRRVEARGHVDHAPTSANVDPLAALDRLEGSAAVAPPPLTFPTALAAKGVPDAPPVDQKVEKIADAKKAEPAPPPAPAADKKDEPKKDEPKKKDKPKKDKDDGRYTLQLSSFQDKGEAEAFLDNIKAAGFEATLTEAEVEGKGTFYRIRLGTYHSLDAANDAKAEFEKAAKKSAYVMRL